MLSAGIKKMHCLYRGGYMKKLSNTQMTLLTEELQEKLHEADYLDYKDILIEYQDKGLDNQHLLIAITAEMNDLIYGFDSPSDVCGVWFFKFDRLLILLNKLWKEGHF